ncbi:MAG: hypothetical protein ABIS26_01255 [Candidatus Paceibacterota bacterium]
MNQNSVLGDSFLSSKYFDPNYLFSKLASFGYQVSHFSINNITDIIAFFHTILFFLTIFFIALISYCSVRMFEIRAKEHKHLEHELAEYAHHQAEKERIKSKGDAVSQNERWILTLSYLFSQHANDWKLAVIEADSMLGELMNNLGFRGETLGEKLKNATQENFHGLSGAWEAHTVRNKIAHEGTAFELSQREAKRVLAIYEGIFREYGFI